MTGAIADLIQVLRRRARVYALVGDKTPSGMMYRAADALTELSASAAAAAQLERERIVQDLRDFARAARDEGRPPGDREDQWWKEITTAEALARKIEDGSLTQMTAKMRLAVAGSAK